MALLLATANKFGVVMASLEIVAKNVVETPEARFKQKALGKYTTGKKRTILEMLKDATIRRYDSF